MQQRQFRPGDVLDDYCPRERRITDHAIVAMIESEILRTRCVSCEAEHEFKNARVPAARRKAPAAALFTQVLDTLEVPAGRLAPPAADPAPPPAPSAPASEVPGSIPLVTPAAAAPPPAPTPAAAPPTDTPSAPADDRPFRRSLIRAQLPRHEGQVATTRAIPEFTMHQPPPPGKRAGQGRFRRRAPGAGESGPMRFGRDQGPPRHGAPGNGAGHGAGNGNGNGNGNGHGGRRRRRKKQR